MTHNEAAAQEQLGVVPNAKEVLGKLYPRFLALVDNRESAREIEKQAKEERGYSDNGKRIYGIDDRVRDMLSDLKAVVLEDGRKVQVVERAGNEYVDVKLLLEAGVTAEVIQRCKRRGAPSWHILVTKAKA